MAKKFWNFKAKDKDNGELVLYGDISSSTWYGDEVTPVNFKKDLDNLGEIKNLDIFINSGGGDVFAGQAIYSMLKRHNATKTVYVDGIAASIASVIAMAGDVVKMPSNAMMMIHKAWSLAIGNSDDMRKMADVMDSVDESITETYIAKTGKDKEEIMEMLKAETWMTAKEAKEYGFADEIIADKKIAASIDDNFLNCNGVKFDMDKFADSKQLIETYRAETEPVVEIKTEPKTEEPKTDTELLAQQTEFFKIKTKLNGGN